MYARLLVPLDGSRLAEAVLPIVVRLAAACGATVALLHIVERAAPSSVHGERHLTTPDEATAYLRQVATRLEGQGLQVEWHTHEVPEGDVAKSIVDHTEEMQADLIVLCTHGRGRVRELLFGAIAQQVLRLGTTPVLLARPTDDGSAPPFAPRSVLVPLDATRAAEAALVPARALARRLNAMLHLVMVVPTHGTVRGDRVPAATLLPRTTQAVLDLEGQEAQTYLEQLAAPLRAPDLCVTTEVRRGDVAASLAAEAAEPDVGLVVVATHGRSGLQAIWAGSVTAALLIRTRNPVLLLRTIEEE
ncbi:MAG TPA: universal stress protein [Chloroflexota bacterium]|nr:universal stress protein [Chloroflexota bacterium]